ncbi:MAG: 3-isopropylmalate dehydratase large subunit [Eubacteriales bacterium]|nr:3-isopropylmalate dehydratase large subunit [Eubacteriales bacterium]
MAKTLYDKVWDEHVIAREGDMSLLYVDMHYIHEVTSPQAFEGLALANRRVRRPDKTFATMDHNTPTVREERLSIRDKLAKEQLDTLAKNCQWQGIRLADMWSEYNGIIHINGPELGFTQPGRVIVCGDSHTATHGAFGAIAHGIGTSEVEHVFATQTIWQKKLKNMGVKITGTLQPGVYAKDVILAFLKEYGVSVGAGYAIEFYGETVRNMSMEERMTLCNMAIEGGAKVGMIAPDEKTYAYLDGRPFAPENMAEKIAAWSALRTDDESAYEKVLTLNVDDLKPQVTWGTHPGMGVDVDEAFPAPKDFNDEKAYAYMDLKPGQRPADIPITEVFIGSCTNGRISDLQAAAKYVRGKRVAEGIRAVIVPGSMQVKLEAERTGLADVFKQAGFEWREPGCSSCLGMNPDLIPEYAHCVSTSNRNFEGRQGTNARTHLVSPAMAAAAAVAGRIVDTRQTEVRHETV